MRGWRVWLLLVSVLAVAACVERSGIPLDLSERNWVYGDTYGYDAGAVDRCGKAAARRTRSVDWAKAGKAAITIEDGRFKPVNVILRRGRPYVLRLANHDDVIRAVRGPEFFAATALAGIELGDRRWAASCLTTIHVPPKQTVGLKLVPEVAGDYEIEDNLSLWGLPITGRGGFAIVLIR